MQSFIDILPYEDNVILANFDFELRLLKLTKFLLVLLISCLETFYIKKEISKFDAHVGENSCQIRAIFLLELLETEYQTHDIQTLLYAINESLIKIKTKIKVVDTVEYKKSFNKKYMTISSYLENIEIYIPLNEEIIILFMCFFLTKYRSYDRNENITINYSSCKNFSKNIFRRIVHKYQIQVSKYSVLYLKENLNKNISLKAFQILMQRDDDGRFVTPCYLSNIIVMNKLKKLKKSILLIIRLENHDLKYLYYILDQSINKYVLNQNPTQDHLNEYCYIIHAILKTNTTNELEKIIERIGLEYLINNLMHHHPQYSGKKLQAVRENPFLFITTLSDFNLINEVKKLKNSFFAMKPKNNNFKALDAHDNLLIIRHIFCDQAINQYKYVLKGCFYIDQIKELCLNSLKNREMYQ